MRHYLLPTHENVAVDMIYNHVISDDVKRVKWSTRDGRDLLAKYACLPSKFRFVPTRRNIHTLQGIEMEPHHTYHMFQVLPYGWHLHTLKLVACVSGIPQTKMSFVNISIWLDQQCGGPGTMK